MELVIGVVALLIGMLIGYLISKHKLHKQCTGSLIFDRAEPKNAPYLAFSSYEELDEIRKKQIATLRVEWANSNSRAKHSL